MTGRDGKTFRGAGGGLSLALLLIFALAAASGFDFTNHSIPTEDIVGGGPAKDGIPSLTSPKFVRAGEAGFMKDSARVIGVALGGEARAYPVSILNWHEAVNDRIAGSAILVTW